MSVFGPGRGEAVLVHMGGNDWVTVDSCIDQVTQLNPVLEYLDHVGVEVSDAVKLVVGTHAHDDHIAGISNLFQRAESAQLVLSSALTSTEFFAQVEADHDIEKQLRLSVRAEYRSVLAEAQLRRTRGLSKLKRAVSQRLLWSREASPDLPAASIIALSPSDEAVTRALGFLAEGTAVAGHEKRLRASDPNEFAVALWISFGEISVLLGADLLVGPSGCGWGAVLEEFEPPSKASLYKVAHHGSPNADHDGVWAELLEEDPVAIAAPFRGGHAPRPTPDDVERIIGRPGQLFLTAQSKVPARSRAVARTQASLSGLARDVRDENGRVGHVRARRTHGQSKWTVDLASPAYRP